MPPHETAPIASPHAPGEREFEELTRITNELITAQRQLYKQSNELRRLNEEKNRAIGIVAHDLRNPLALVKLQTEVLLQDLSGVLTDEHRALLQCIIEQGSAMLTIVNDLLDVSAIEAGSFGIRRESVDLVPLVKRFVQSQSLLSASKSIAIDFTSAVPSLFAHVDAGKIQQVLSNLIGNAVKYSPVEAQVVVSLSTLGDVFELRVQDFGPGIPADELETLFEPFKTASIVPGEGEKSTGLGLTIVRRIIEKHDGTLSVDSKVGDGTVFSVRLPLGLSDGPDAMDVHPHAVRTPVTSGKDASYMPRVLVVDDCKASAKMMSRLVDGVCRSDVETANDGVAALEKAIAFKPDLVLLDIEMPGMDGRQVAKRIREHSFDKHPMVCAVTAHSERELERLSQTGCFDSIVSKPIAMADLKRLIHSAAGFDEGG